MARTTSIIQQYIPLKPLVSLIDDYLCPAHADEFSVGSYGHGERCSKSYSYYTIKGICIGGHEQLFDAHYITSFRTEHKNDFLTQACRGGHTAIANILIDQCGANAFDSGLVGACWSGNRTLAEEMIRRGADYWDEALASASQRGHLDIALEMIERGASDIAIAIWYACRHGHIALAKMFIARFPSSEVLNNGLHGACAGNETEIAELLIKSGASSIDESMVGVCHRGHVGLARVMIAHGARDFHKYLSIACSHGHVALAAMMINHCAE